MLNARKTPVRVGLISLGCAKNLVDAEIMLGSLIKSGVEITNDAKDADVVIVNTCSFIEAAQQESIDAILESDEVRTQTNPGQGLIVSGCLPQRFRENLPKLLPEVDAFMGIDQVEQVFEIVEQALARRQERVATKTGGTRGPRSRSLPKLPAAGELVNVHHRPNYIPDFATPRFRLTPKHFAYVKIAEGCNHPCSFCIIPRMRGSHRSRTQSDVVKEARELIASGVKELNLISQDSTYYGLDLRAGHSRAISSPERFTAAAQSLPAEATTLCTLLRELNELPGQFWIRLLYTHPAHWTDELIRTIAECPKVARYVDMPLQHIHENMLERMRRETSQKYIIDLIARIRTGIPGIALRTTFIVGFPGETEAYFESLVEFIRETRFERLGVFTYSQQEDTRAAGMQGQVPDARKKQRQQRAMAEQLKIAREISASRVGSDATVLIERHADARDLEGASVSSWEHGLIRATRDLPSDGDGVYWLARGEADAPDIDGRVYVCGNATEGAFARVKVIGHTDYDLIAELA
ncbi:MAG TPA: 30S ribosomal protein S12 methylthiotransferase RimO [Verrucomicrobiae bacterium]|jgi:ribosomal protein S12 methylthiotransferase|nr:30S ribosomal protein S12 methylthiotransferase RimO [Verrucomicrobiae bacterium]